MVGNSSQLFEPEDFEKVKVNELKSINPDLERKSEDSVEKEATEVRIEIVGDTSHLFKPEDFEKEDSKLLHIDNESSNLKLEVDYVRLMLNQTNAKIDEEEAINSNDSIKTNSSKTTDGEKGKVIIECNLKIFENNENKVKLVNGTSLTLMLSESKLNDCLIVMFYVPWCPFSARLAPYYNALPRAFNQLDILAFDVSKSTGYVAQTSLLLTFY